VTRIDKSFLLQAFAKMFHRQSPELARILVVPRVPTLVTQEIIESGLATLRLPVLGRVPNDSKPVLNRDEQINLGVRCELPHRGNRDLGDARRVDESNHQS
jgi:hypothetical protein